MCRVVIDAIAGSTSPEYRQLDWRSQRLMAKIHVSAEASGDPMSGWLPRNWRHVAIVAASRDDLANLESQAASAEFEQAVAYIVDGVPHVSTLPDNESLLLRELGEDELGIAMRLGKKALSATMGLWIDSRREFLGVERPITVEPSVSISALPSTPYSNMLIT